MPSRRDPHLRLCRAVYDGAYTVVSRGGAFFNLDYIFPAHHLSGLYARTAGSNPWGGARSAEPGELEQRNG